MSEYHTEEEHAYHEPEAVLERSGLTRKQILLESAQALENYLDTHYCKLLRAMAKVVPEESKQSQFTAMRPDYWD